MEICRAALAGTGDPQRPLHKSLSSWVTEATRGLDTYRLGLFSPQTLMERQRRKADIEKGLQFIQ